MNSRRYSKFLASLVSLFLLATLLGSAAFPTRVRAAITAYTAISAGRWYTCALTASGGVKCWGDNRDGQLGDGTTSDRTTPVDVIGLTSGVSAITTSWFHTCALTTGGGVKCWGINNNGQLGDGTTEERWTPVDVTGLTSGVRAISVGWAHTCALTTGGGVKCWGYNDDGELGDGTTTQHTTPVDVIGMTNDVEYIEAGGWHTCAMKYGSGLKCWGANGAGQLGDGTTIDHITPGNVSGMTSGVFSISAGGWHTCAATSAGVKCWGLNNNGQLGEGTTAYYHSSPTDVVGLSNGASAISAGEYHTCAVVSGGGAMCWGWNGDGQLGNGDGGNSHIPVDVIGLTSGLSAITAGGNHSCALTSSGGIKCWGWNYYGQLGDGTTTDRHTPVDVVGSSPPSVASITRADINPTHATSVHFTVTFSATVTGVDTSDFTLATTGSITGVSVTDVSGTGTTYIVTVNTGSENGSLRLDVVNDGTILDLASNPLSSGFTSGESYSVDKTAPTVVSSVRANPNPTTATSVHFTVTFSEDVTGVNAAAFTLTKTGTISSASVTGVTGGPKAYTVAVNTGTENGTIRLDLNASGTGIQDLASNPISGGFAGGENYTIDKTPPTVLSSLRANPNPTTATSVHFTVTFSESVTGVDKTDFSLTASGITGASVTAVSGSGATRTVSVNTGSGHGTLRLNVVDNDTIKDGAGNQLGGTGAGNGNYTSGQKYTLDRDNQFRSAAAQDGWVLESSETSGKGGSLAATGNLRLGDDAANKQYRSLLYFNTAGLPNSATITKVTLKIRKAGVTGTDPFTTHGSLLADIKQGAFGASPLEIGDFQATASKTSVGHFTKVSGSTVWYQLVLGAANYSYINKTGVTQFRLRFTKDDNDDHGADYVSFYAGDATTASNQPLLIVEYTLP